MTDEHNIPIGLFDDASTVVTGGLPTATLGYIIRDLWSHQKEVARDELLRAFARGEVDEQHLISNRDFPSILVKYAAAARDCAARKNLRLLAEVISGLNRRKQLYTDEFERYADILSRMTRDQMIVSGRLLAHLKTEFGCHPLRAPIEDHDPAWQESTKTALANLRIELVPKVFPTQATLRVILSQLTASGLLLTDPILESTSYEPSHLLIELHDLTDLEGAAKVHRST